MTDENKKDDRTAAREASLSVPICSGVVSGSSLTRTDWQEIDRLVEAGREDLAWLIRSGQVSASEAKIRWDAEADEANGWHSLGGDEKDQLLSPNVESTREAGSTQSTNENQKL